MTTNMKTYKPVRAAFVVTEYKGKPAILDIVTKVYYFGFKTREAAQKRCDALNKGF